MLGNVADVAMNGSLRLPASTDASMDHIAADAWLRNFFFLPPGDW